MRDPWWMHFLLAVHITAGSGAFMVAPLALVTAKGGKAHRRWGTIYFRCMAIVAFTALVMAAYRPILFLALVAIFSFYAAFTAYRVLGRRRPGKENRSSVAWTGSPPSCASRPAQHWRCLVPSGPRLCRTCAFPHSFSEPSACAFLAEPFGVSHIRQRRRCFGGTPTCKE